MSLHNITVGYDHLCVAISLKIGYPTTSFYNNLVTTFGPVSVEEILTANFLSLKAPT